MNLISIRFAIFSAVLLVFFYRIPQKWQWVVLLAASFCFYLCAGTESLFFILFTILTTYFCARCIGRNQARLNRFLSGHPALTREDKRCRRDTTRRQNRLLLALCLTANFGLLFFCKACLIQPLHQALSDGRLSFLTLALPLGISFFLFQSAGYVIDVYRGTVPAERNPCKYALFVCYFPQLIQGPISRFSPLSEQLFRGHPFDGKEVSFGLQRMLWGYFKKLVVADRIAPAVAALRQSEYTGAAFGALTLFYAIQIYGDFTGGIDIALGLSQALGIRLPENFCRPFFSKSTAEYWRRWHITLGQWMKDDIFFPVSVSAGVRKLSRISRSHWNGFGKRLPVYAASIVTWLATGIWHGLTPNFVLWGMLNCLVIVVSEELTPLYRRFHSRFALKDKPWYGLFEIIRTFLLMNLIRACDLFPHVGDYWSRVCSLFTGFHLRVFWDGTLMGLGLTGLDYLILAGSAALMLAVSLIQEKTGSVRELLWRWPAPVRRGLLFLLGLAVLLMGHYGIGYQASSFLYNQF